jgi:hypothetical protein
VWGRMASCSRLEIGLPNYGCFFVGGTVEVGDGFAAFGLVGVA